VLVGLESAFPSERLLASARLLSEAGPCEIEYVHFLPKALLVGRLKGLVEQSLRARLTDFESPGRPLKLTVLADGDSPGEALAGLTRQEPIDLMIVGIQPRTGFSSVRSAETARTLLHQSKTAVLAVPLEDRARAPYFQSVLVPTDLSELGNGAVPYAYALAERGSSVVTLLYVYEAPLGLHGTLQPSMRESYELRLRSLVPPVPTIRS
jgi:nucleotide-binding universal stress UspA family protein